MSDKPSIWQYAFLQSNNKRTLFLLDLLNIRKKKKARSCKHDSRKIQAHYFLGYPTVPNESYIYLSKKDSIPINLCATFFLWVTFLLLVVVTITEVNLWNPRWIIDNKVAKYLIIRYKISQTLLAVYFLPFKQRWWVFNRKLHPYKSYLKGELPFL